jgi:hypothetical protein
MLWSDGVIDLPFGFSICTSVKLVLIHGFVKEIRVNTA